MIDNKDYYKILGISKDATIDEIKSSYRQLCKIHHPDIVGADNKHNLQYFQQINHAADILTNPIKRKQYDIQQENNNNNPLRQSFYDPYRRIRRTSSSSSYQQQHGNGIHHTLEIIFRPRNFFIIGPITFISAITIFRWMNKQIDNNNNSLDNDDHDNKIQAWMNPITNQYETPAPWDPLYQQMKPKLIYIPREQVKTRTR